MHPPRNPELVEKLLDAVRQYIFSRRDHPRDSRLHVANYKLMVESYRAVRPPASDETREPEVIGLLTPPPAIPGRIVVDEQPDNPRPWWLRD